MTHNFDEIINRLGTFCTQWDYMEDRFGEKELLPFSISDTDFACPKPIIEELEKRVAHGIFGYTRWNHDYFKLAITNWFSKRFESSIEKEWIVYSPTVMYSISVFIRMLSKEGDGVVAQEPMYDAYFNIVKDNNRELLKNKLILNNGRYEIDFKDLEEKLSRENTKIFLLCTPHNPTGRVWTRDELKKMIELCKKYNVFLISDDIHMDIVYEGHKHTPVLNLSKENDKICICSSSSKTMNTPGLIGSYVIIKNKIIREKFLKQLKNRDALSSVSILGMHATITAYNECEYYVDEMNKYVYENMKILKNFIDENLPNVSFTIPDGTYLAWIDVSKLKASREEIQEVLVHKGKVAIMAGEVYGESGKGFLRLNLGCPKEKLLEGLRRMKNGLQYLEY